MLVQPNNRSSARQNMPFLQTDTGNASASKTKKCKTNPPKCGHERPISKTRWSAQHSSSVHHSAHRPAPESAATADSAASALPDAATVSDTAAAGLSEWVTRHARVFPSRRGRARIVTKVKHLPLTFEGAVSRVRAPQFTGRVSSALPAGRARCCNRCGERGRCRRDRSATGPGSR